MWLAEGRPAAPATTSIRTCRRPTNCSALFARRCGRRRRSRGRGQQGVVRRHVARRSRQQRGAGPHARPAGRAGDRRARDHPRRGADAARPAGLRARPAHRRRDPEPRGRCAPRVQAAPGDRALQRRAGAGRARRIRCTVGHRTSPGAGTGQRTGVAARCIEAFADSLEAAVDLDRLLQRCAVAPLRADPVESRQDRATGAVRGARRGVAVEPLEPLEPVRVAIARDRAFGFYYPEDLEALARGGRRAGAVRRAARRPGFPRPTRCSSVADSPRCWPLRCRPMPRCAGTSANGSRQGCPPMRSAAA